MLFADYRLDITEEMATLKAQAKNLQKKPAAGLSMTTIAENTGKKLPKLSKTPVPGLSQHHPSVRTTEKNDFELELKAKHRILKSMIYVDKQEGALQDTSSLSFSFKRMSAGMKVIGNYNNKEKLLGKVVDNLHVPSKFSVRVPGSDKIAREKVIADKYNAWAASRGKKTLQRTNSFVKFLDEFFDSMDENNTEVLVPKELVVPLVSFGVASSEVYLVRAIKLIFGTADLSRTIAKRDFMKRLAVDKATGTMLESFSYYTNESFSGMKKQFQQQYPLVEAFIQMVHVWWNEISSGNPQVHISQISIFFVQKRLLSSLQKAIKFCKNFSSDDFFDSILFENLFLKCILVAQLLNIKHGVDLQKISAPMHLKIAVYQRNTLLNGVDPSLNQSNRELLREVYKAAVKHDMRASSHRLSLKHNALLAEKANTMKLKQVIYEAEHQGSEFVGFKGDIKKDISSPWEIKNAIVAKDEDAQKAFREKDYLSTLTKNLDPSALVVKPYERNVKMFRDNFLFEKFQSVSIPSPFSSK
jgi:hypothetical protein